MNLIEAYARSLEKSLANASPSSTEMPIFSEIPEEPDTLHQNKHAAKRCSPPVQEKQIVYESLEDARPKLLQIMKDYLAVPNPDYMLLIRANAGMGKTTAGVLLSHWVHDELGEHVLYAGPRHNFFQDILEASNEQGKKIMHWLEWLPRQRDMDDPTLDTCKETPHINDFIARGFNAERYCSAICGRDYMKTQCPYLAQAKRLEPLIYAQHQHVSIGHPLAKKCKLLIGDENPMQTFGREIEIPADQIYFSNLDPESDLGQVIIEIKERAARGESLSGFMLWATLGIQNVIDACEPYTKEQIKRMTTPRLEKPSDVAELGYNVLPILIPLMLREAKEALKQVGQTKITSDFISRIHIRKGNLVIHARREIAKEMPTHMIWVDATGAASIYEELCKRKVKVIQPNVKIAGRIYQVMDNRNSKGSLVKYAPTSPETKAETAVELTTRAQQLREQIEWIVETQNPESPDGSFKNPAIISAKALQEYLGSHAYFYGSRGTNAFQDCDVLIIAGTPMSPLSKIQELAATIWFDRMKPFDNKWQTVERKYNYVDEEDGLGWCIDVNEYADPSLNAVLWQQREAELIQCAHRARILFRDVPVYLLTNLPVDELPPTKLISTRELMTAPDGVNIFLWHTALKFAETMDKETGGVSVSDFVEGLGIDRGTAERYFNALLERGWENYATQKQGRGRPKRMIRKTNLNE